MSNRRRADLVAQQSPLEKKIDQIETAYHARGWPVSADGYVSQAAAADFLGIANLTLQNQEYIAGAP